VPGACRSCEAALSEADERRTQAEILVETVEALQVGAARIGLQMGCTWGARGVHMGCTWGAHGVHMGCSLAWCQLCDVVPIL
jgi:hypothetical protein